MDAPPRGVLVLLLAVGCSRASPHSLRYFYTGLSEPGQGLPQFSIVGYVDNQPFVKYESNGRKMLPQVPWMEKVVEYEAGYWESQSQILQGTESVFRGNLVTLRERFNQQNNTGLHTWQWMYGCEVGLDGQPCRGHYQFAYDGEDFLAFDKKTVSWVAAVPQAEISKQKLDKQQYISQGQKDYLEGTCVEWLRRYLAYGKEALQRTERPAARVARKKGYDGRETLFCYLYGFYPKEIEVTWMKDEEDRKPETMSGGVVPNSDGTYHTWLSIEVDPKEKDRYRCRVGHDSLLEPLDLAWEEPAPDLGLFLGIVGMIFSAAAILVGGIAFRRILLKSYKAASKKRPPGGDAKPLPLKHPLENGYKPVLNGCQRPESSSSALLVNPTPHLSLLSSEDASQITVSSERCSSQSSSDSSDGCSHPGSDSTKALV